MAGIVEGQVDKLGGFSNRLWILAIDALDYLQTGIEHAGRMQKIGSVGLLLWLEGLWIGLDGEFHGFDRGSQCH